MNHFDYINSITANKKYLMVDDLSEKQYSPWMVNSGLSHFMDTVFHANEMNASYCLDAKLQYDYLINSISQGFRRRDKKAPKDEAQLENLLIVKEHYGYSNEKARSALTILSSEQLNELKQRHFKGGHSTTKSKH